MAMQSPKKMSDEDRKAAFYDREAHMSLRDRYQFSPKYDNDYTSVYTVVKDGEVEIHRTKTFTGDRSAVFDEADRQRETAAKWMTKNRPTWKDPIKQWDREATVDSGVSRQETMKTITEVRVGDVWQSNGPKKAKVRVCEITSAGLVRWSGITIRDNGIARDFTRNRMLVERDGNPVTANRTPEPS